MDNQENGKISLTFVKRRVSGVDDSIFTLSHFGGQMDPRSCEIRGQKLRNLEKMNLRGLEQKCSWGLGHLRRTPPQAPAWHALCSVTSKNWGCAETNV